MTDEAKVAYEALQHLANHQGEPLTLPLAHLNIAAKRYGDPELPIILACHGWLDNLNSFVPLAEAFLQSELAQQYQLITFDWPGHGLSDHRASHYPLHWVDYIYDLDAVVSYLLQHSSKPEQPQQMILLGHSLGGIVASAYQAAMPERVSQLILIEAIAPIFEPAERIKPRLTKSLLQHRHKSSSNASLDKGYDSVLQVARAREKLTKLPLGYCALISDRNLVLKQGGYQWRSDPRLKLDSIYRMTFEQVDELMRHSQIPTLLILGDQGYEALKLAIDKAQSWYEQLTVVQLSGDHHLHMSQAKALIQHIGAFILKSKQT